MLELYVLFHLHCTFEMSLEILYRTICELVGLLLIATFQVMFHCDNLQWFALESGSSETE
jgi:hypothetical protein